MIFHHCVLEIIIDNNSMTTSKTKERVKNFLRYAPYMDGISSNIRPKLKSNKKKLKEEKDSYDKICDEYESETNSDWMP